MLILSRKANEKIHLSGGITITLLERRGDRTRIGIDAPKGVDIWRDELGAPELAKGADGDGKGGLHNFPVAR